MTEKIQDCKNDNSLLENGFLAVNSQVSAQPSEPKKVKYIHTDLSINFLKNRQR